MNEKSRRVKRAISNLGIDVAFSKNTSPVDFTHIDDPNPLELAYHYGARSALLTVPLDRCRHMRMLAFPCCKKNPSPFVEIIMQGFGEHNIKNKILENLYESFRPKNVEEILGIGLLENREVASASPAGAILPWFSVRVNDQIAIEDKAMRDESRQYGKELDLSQGHIFFGPSSQQKIKLEYQRLEQTLISIKKRGYIPDPTGYMNINVTCLWSDEKNDWRFLIQGGEHRVAVLVALGYTKVVVQMTRHGLTGIVQRSHAKYWPSVTQGFFTEDEAVRLFDRIYDGEQPLSYLKMMGGNENRSVF